MPRLKLTTEKSKGAAKTNYAYSDYLGVNHTRAGSNKRDESYVDLVRAGAYHAGGGTKHEVHLDETANPGTDLAYSYFFSLDDVVWAEASGSVYYKEGSRAQANAADSSVTR